MELSNNESLQPGGYFNMANECPSSSGQSTPGDSGNLSGNPSTKQRERKRVQFERNSSENDKLSSQIAKESMNRPSRTPGTSPHKLQYPVEHHPDVAGPSTLARPRPAIRRDDSHTFLSHDIPGSNEEPTDDTGKVRQRQSGIKAQETAKKLAAKVAPWSAPTSRQNSLDLDQSLSFKVPPADARRPSSDDDESDEDDPPLEMKQKARDESEKVRELRESLGRLARTTRHVDRPITPQLRTHKHRSGQVTPDAERQHYHDYIPHPGDFRAGTLSSLLKLGHAGRKGFRSVSHLHLNRLHQTPNVTPSHSPASTETSTPVEDHPSTFPSERSHSASSLTKLMARGASLPVPYQKELGENIPEQLKSTRKEKGRYSPSVHSLSNSIFSRPSEAQLQEELRIKIHIAGNLARQGYLTKLCRALMLFGAPTHRLEEYMRMSARVLEVEGQFLYIPGCMIISFDDSKTHTTEVKIVRTSQGVDLGRLRVTHDIYKEVVHDKIGVEEAMERLTATMDRGPQYPVWLLVLLYGLASACVGPFAFQARVIDLPIAFFLGCILGILQLVIAPSSDLYANVFEVTATVITSLLARMFGSIGGGKYFCFSALAQSSIALILPGYTVLCGSLELQSRSLIAGAVRLVYAVLYTLFLGYGITIGTVLYGLMDHKATSQPTCDSPLPSQYNFIFAFGFTICLVIINQAKLSQLPSMAVISMVGYVVNYFSSQRLQGNAQVSNTLGALAIGTLANLHSRLGGPVNNWFLDLWENRFQVRWNSLQARYRRNAATNVQGSDCEKGANDAEHNKRAQFEASRSKKRRVGHGLAAASMLPAIFVQVPSGLAVGGSLIAGIQSADQIVTGNGANTTVNPYEGTTHGFNSISFTVSLSVIQVAIGITVGLFLSALVVYPLGKRRSGLFSF